MAANQQKTRIVFVGGGHATARALLALQKQPADVKDNLDVTIIDPQDYFQSGVTIQRIVVQPEKATFATVLWTDVIAALGFGKHIQGFVSSISSKNKVRNFSYSSQGQNVTFSVSVCRSFWPMERKFPLTIAWPLLGRNIFRTPG